MGIIDAPVVPALRRLCRAASGSVLVVAMVAFVGGWLFDVRALRNLVPGTIEMKPFTAVGLFCSAAALGLLLDLSVSGRRRLVGRMFAVIPVVIGAAVLGEFVFGWRLGMDELLFRDGTGHALRVPYPGRLAPTTAINLILIGVSLLALDSRVRRGWSAAELLVLPVVVIAATSVIGYIYAIPQFYGPASAAKMALNTAVCFLVLAGGVVLARPHGRLVRLATTDDPGGIMTRRLLPLAVGLPILLGWARLAAVHAKVFDDRVGAWWLSAATAVGFALLISRVAARLSRYAAERGLLEAELHHLANHDPLTGLLNRRRFHEEMIATAQTTTRYGHHACLLNLDLDRMKKVNDELGHKAGDDLLQTIASVLTDRLRDTDRAARLGGDEFAVLLPNTDLHGASVVAEDLRSCIAERCAPLTCTAWTTVSIGVAHFSKSERVDDVMARADQAMYDAKRSGGDRVAKESSVNTQRGTLAQEPTSRSDLHAPTLVTHEN